MGAVPAVAATPRMRIARSTRRAFTASPSLVACAAVLALCVLSACAPPLLSSDERNAVCQVAVNDKLDAPTVRGNLLANPLGGPLIGILVGGLSLNPVGFMYAASYGTACGVTSLTHPNAERDFKALFLGAYGAGSMKRAIEDQLNAPRANCASAPAIAATAREPDTRIEIDSVAVEMGCAFGAQEYVIAVKWRAISTRDNRMIVEATTRCGYRSYLEVDEWSANPDRAKKETERVLAKTGNRMAAEVLSSQGLNKCLFRSGSAGEIEDR